MKGEPDWMRDFRLKSLEDLRVEADADAGAATIDIEFDDIYYYLKPTDDQSGPGTTCPRTSRRPSTSWAFPRPRRSTSPA